MSGNEATEADEPGPSSHGESGRGGASGRRRRQLENLGWALRRPSLVAGLAITGFFVAMALMAPVWYPHNLTSLSMDTAYLIQCSEPSPPTLQLVPFSTGPHPFGETIFMGYDVAQGLVVGSRWDLFLVAAIALPAAGLGLGAGLVAGSSGGRIDWLIMTLIDVILAVPYFVFVLLLVGVLAPHFPLWAGPYLFIFAMVLVLWAPFARGVRGEAARVAHLPYVEAAYAAGSSRGHVIRRHVLPNSLYPVLAQIPVTVALTLALVVGVQFVVTASNWANSGFGCGYGLAGPTVAPVTPSFGFPEWGLVLSTGAVAWVPAPGITFLSNAWWGFVIPAVWIALFGLGILFLSDGLRDVLDPRLASK